MGVTVSQLDKGQESSFWSKFNGDLQLSSKSSILRRVSHEALWDNFLVSTANSFAVTTSDLRALLRQSVVSRDSMETENNVLIKDYIDNICDLNEQGDAQVVDFMAVCSSVLLLSSDSLEEKIEKLFSWIDMDMDNDISIDEFYISIVSFERGLSYALGRKPCSEEYLFGVAKQWFSVCGFGRENETVKGAKLGKEKFFDFCTNRHYSVRLLFECFGAAIFPERKSGEDLSNLVVRVGDHEAKAGVMKEPGGGDEWLANPPWIKTAEKMIPKNCVKNSSKPDVSVQLDWVHGYRGFDCRNNLRYVNADGTAFAFNAAGLGIVQTTPSPSKEQECQYYFGEHTDDVICLAVAEPISNAWDGCLVATGEIGKVGTIHIWNPVQHMQSLACLTGCHPKGVSLLVFSRDGSKLFSVGVEYTVAVHCTALGDSKFGKLIGSAQGPKGIALGAFIFGSSDAEPQFVTCGEKHVVVWTLKGKSLTMETVKLGSFKNDAFLCGARFGASGSAVIGTAQGHQLVLDGNTKSVSELCADAKAGNKQDAAAVAACWSNPEGSVIILGDSSGNVRMWTANDSVPSPACSFLINSDDPSSKRKTSVRSICMSSDGRKVLVGTLDCEVMELILPTSGSAGAVTSVTGVILNRGHFKDELWGLAVNPTCDEYCTVGDDSFLRIWSYSLKKQVRAIDMKTMARCCAYSADGSMIAVGYGGRVGKGKQKQQDGLVRVYDAKRFLVLFETRDSKKWVSDVKFSKDGRFFAVGTHDNSIYVYSVPQQFKRKFKFSKHNSYITHFDFSSDGSALQSNCGAYELLFCSTDSGAQISAGSSLSETDWASWTCPLGWPVLGIWPPGADGTDINAVDRSHSGLFLATADDFGKLKLFRYPCTVPNSNFVEFSGHSSHVTNVRWCAQSDAWLVTTGGNDKCVFQWKNINETAPSSERVRNTNPSTVHINPNETYNVDDGPSGGDEFMAVKPWKGAIVAPTAASNPDSTRVVQFKAALGEMCSLSIGLNDSGKEPSIEQYKALSSSAEVVWDRLCDSGHVDTSFPEQDDLVLDHVYGYRGFDCRNNVFYISGQSTNRSVVYPAAALGIVMDSSTQSQKFFRGHTDDIVSISVHKDSSSNEILIATGQMGPGNICVWTTPSMNCKATFSTKQKTVNNIAFSRDGRLVISIAADNSVCVSEWSSQRVLASVAGDPAPTYHVACSSDPTALFLSCGNKYIRIWSLNGKNLTSSKVSTGSPQQFLSVAFFMGHWVVGAEDGKLIVIEKAGKKVVFSTTHSDKVSASKTKDSVTALHVCEPLQLLFSGSSSGVVSVWSMASDTTSMKLSKIMWFSACDVMTAANKLPLTARQIHSLHCTVVENNIYLLIGTRGCDIIEVLCNVAEKKQELVPKSSGGIEVRGHCNDELWGLACHPKKPEFITVGDDKTLKKWSIHQKKLLVSAGLGVISRACCYDPSGDLIAIGFGGRVGRGKQKQDGLVRIYNEASLEMKCEMKDAKQWISDIKFSPDGLTLAVGSHNNTIYLYSVSKSGSGVSASASLSLRCKFSKHNSYITHFDFSADSRFIQSNCGAYELLFSNVSNGQQITSASELKDVNWATWTCTLGWPVQGIWPSGSDGTDINAVDRSHSGHLVATSDDFGKVSLFRYPCVDGAQSSVYSGHSSHVMNVRWSLGDRYLLTAGGNDKCVLQWRHIMMNGESTHTITTAGTDISGIEEEVNDHDDGPGGGDEAGAVKPWLGAIRPPSDPPALSNLAPTTSLELSWVHGYTSGNSGNGYRVSSNLFYNTLGDILYPAASLGVKLHVAKNSAGAIVERTQTYFSGHDDDILCLNISSDRSYIATGQTASKATKGKGTVCIWSAGDCRLLTKLEKIHDRAVVSVAFSPCGTKLLTVGQDNNYSHSVWVDSGGSWSRVTLLASLKSDGNPILFSRWFSAAASSDNQFISGGGANINFWKIEGASLSKKPGKFGKQSKSPVLCAANLRMKDKWRVVVGISTGHLYIFEDRDCVNSIPDAHTGAVICLQEGSVDCQFLVSGGMDKCVKVWNQALQPVSFFQLTQDINTSPINASVGSIDIKFDDTKNLIILAGTFGGEVMEISSGHSEHNTKQAGSLVGLTDANFDLSNPAVSIILQSHYSGELWGLATHPTDPDIVATVGDDATLRLWSISKNKMVGCHLLKWPGRCVCWNPSGDLLAIGLHELVKGGLKNKKSKKLQTANSSTDVPSGCCVIVSVALDTSGKYVMTELARGGTSIAWISDIKFSPSGRMLAFGSHDQRLYMYDAPECNDSVSWAQSLSKTKFKPYDKHSSAITHFDFSLDEQYLQSNCQAYELLFMRLDKGTQEPSASKLADYNNRDDHDNPDRKWASWTCTLGWPVQGIWPPGADGTDINSVDRSPLGTIVATADDFGLVKLFRYPSATEKSDFLEFSGHSSHVTNVRFTASGDNLLSVGGNDKCLFVWRLINK